MFRSHHSLIAAGALAALTALSGAAPPTSVVEPPDFGGQAESSIIGGNADVAPALGPVGAWPVEENFDRGGPECGDLSYSQSFSMVVENPSVWCGTTQNSDETSIARGFTADTDISIECVTVGVRGNAGGPTVIWTTIYRGGPGEPFASLIPIGFGAMEVADSSTGQLVTIPLSRDVFPETLLAEGENFTVEVTSQSRMPSGGDAGGLLRFGFNNDGQTSQTYFRSNSCNEPDHVDLAELGFANRHLVLSVGAFSYTASPVECERLTIDNGSFEAGAAGSYFNVMNNFVSNQGTWGVEVGAIVSGPSDGVNPRTGSQMLRMTNASAVMSQVVQAVPLGSMADLVDAGLLTASFDGWFNASNGVAAASMYTMIRFYSSASLSSEIAVFSDGRVLDASPGTWQSQGVSAAIPAGARWMVVEVGFRNSSIGGAAGFVDDATLCIARNCVYKTVGNSGFESSILANYATVLNNFSTSAGVWGVEAGSVATGPSDSVSPLRGGRMLRLVNDGLLATQAVQVIDLHTQSSLIDLGGTKATFGAYFNASAGVSAANSYAMIRFYGSGGFGDPIGISQTSKTLDALPGRWEWNATSKAVPVGTRWIVLEVGFANTTIGSLAGFVDDAVFCLGCDCERLTIKDAGFQRLPLGSYSTVLNNFSTQQGIWGAESATIATGLVDGVWAHKGNRMLRMTDDGLVATQAVQVLNVSSLASLIDSIGLDATFAAQMNASSGVAAATGSTTIRFYGASGFGNPLTPITAGRVLDSDSATWEATAVRGTVPFGTRWIVTEVAFSNATIGSQAGFVDSTKLCLTRRSLIIGGYRYNALNGAVLASAGDLTVIEPPVPLAGDYGVGIEFGTAVSGISAPVVAWENLPGEHVSFTFANDSAEDRFEFEHVATDTTRLHTSYADGNNVSNLLIFNEGQLVIEIVDVNTGEVIIHHKRAIPLPDSAPNPEVGVKLKLTCSWRRHYRLDSISPIIKFEVTVGENTYLGDTVVLARGPVGDIFIPGCQVFIETNAAAGLALSGNAAAAVGSGESRPLGSGFEHLNTQGVFVSLPVASDVCPPRCPDLFAGDFFGLGHASLRMVSDPDNGPAEVLFDFGGVDGAELFLNIPPIDLVRSEDFFSIIEFESVAAGGGPAGRFTVDHPCDGCPWPFDNDSGYSISGDFSSIGSETYTLQLWNGGTLVYEEFGVQGLGGHVTAFPELIGKLGGLAPCGKWGWPHGCGMFVPSVGATFDITEVRMLAEGLSEPLPPLESIYFRSWGVAELTFADITTVLPDASSPCPPDLNNDGVIDFFDVLIFVGWFSSSDLQADWNDDGILDFFDIIDFVSDIDAGCP